MLMETQMREKRKSYKDADIKDKRGKMKGLGAERQIRGERDERTAQIRDARGKMRGNVLATLSAHWINTRVRSTLQPSNLDPSPSYLPLSPRLFLLVSRICFYQSLEMTIFGNLAL
jgi:hypothetical protein